MTRPWWERSYKRLSNAEVEELAAAADQRNLTVKASVANVAAEVENDQQESVMQLNQAHDLLAKTVHATLSMDLEL